MPPSGALHSVHQHDVAAVEDQIVDVTGEVGHSHGARDFAGKLPTPADAHWVPRGYLQAARQGDEALCNLPGDAHHATHPGRLRAGDAHQVAGADLLDGHLLGGPSSGEPCDKAGRRETATTRTGVVRGHVRGRRDPGRGAAAEGARRRSRLGGREREEDAVALVAQGPEAGAAVQLQARVHAVGARLQLVGANQCPQVVLSPPVEPLFAIQRLGHAASCIRLQRPDAAVRLGRRLQGVHPPTEFRNHITCLLALVLQGRVDRRVARAH
mmetsp:Transcript_122524/g.381393  ORF Transcript_122524/g.381393 Transcript_122524/m.381393 type:complete len:269 (+) Transcript_122524:803-1609(+)